MGTIDNIYVLNYLITKQIGKKGGKLVAFFVDLKATFDSVNRGILIRALRGRRVGERLISKYGDVLTETKIIRVGDELGESFWTRRRVMQGLLSAEYVKFADS